MPYKEPKKGRQKYYKANKEKFREYKLRYVQGQGYASHADWLRARRALLRDSVMEMLGGCCRHCGFNDKRALQIDHIYGGGNKEAKRTKHNWSTGYYKKILEENGAGYQLLCANCNWIKRVENGE